MRTLNLGILAHVDAGKTSLTERLLYAAGVIDKVGSVDGGDTQTDTLALERQRGITIKAAVVSFVVGDITINLIDTPGHPDFIAEVERVINVLDGAVLVISAVEGIQAQTRILMRALQRLRIPTLIFVNKIDRRGADPERVMRSIAEKLTPAVVSMGTVENASARAAKFAPHDAGDRAFGARLTEVLANHDDAILSAYVGDAAVIPDRSLRDALARQTKQALVHPVFFGSAITGAGTDALIAGIADLLPAMTGDADGPLSGTVFKVERGPAGEKIAYVRMFSGKIQTRDQLQLDGEAERKVTAVSVFDRGSTIQRPAVIAGQIGKLWGLGDIRIGDAIGQKRASTGPHQFAPPTLETLVVPRNAADRSGLHVALTRLAEQDPLINLRHDAIHQEIYVSLYGEVQKEVIQQTLAADFGIEVEFRETTVICIERPIGTGTALFEAPDPFIATIGLRVEPGPPNSGIAVRLEIEFGSMPLSFHRAVEWSAIDTLRQGLFGWQVTDCIVTMTQGIRMRKWGGATTAAEHRNLTPLVVMAALRQAGTVVCEPVQRFQLEIPADTIAAALPVLVKYGANLQPVSMQAATSSFEGDIPAAQVNAVQQLLPGLTRGEGVFESAFDHHRPVTTSPIPSRRRSDFNPLDRDEYVRRLQNGR